MTAATQRSPSTISLQLCRLCLPRNMCSAYPQRNITVCARLKNMLFRRVHIAQQWHHTTAGRNTAELDDRCNVLCIAAVAAVVKNPTQQRHEMQTTQEENIARSTILLSNLAVLRTNIDYCAIFFYYCCATYNYKGVGLIDRRNSPHECVSTSS